MGSGNLVTKKVVRRPSSIDQDIKFDQSWVEDVACPICLDSPHNAVLLRCASYEKGCRPFICDTDQTRSNCLERFRGAHGLPLPVPANARASSRTVSPLNSIHTITISSSNANNNRPACPLCRGDVMGWFVIGEARSHLNQKRRCCEESRCSYVGSFHELQRHTQQKHPDSRPRPFRDRPCSPGRLGEPAAVFRRGRCPEHNTRAGSKRCGSWRLCHRVRGR